MINFTAVLLAALVPLALGFLWYSPFLFGPAWQRLAGLSAEKLQRTNKIVLFLSCYALSFLIAFTLNFIVIHQLHFYSAMAGDKTVAVKGSEAYEHAQWFMARYGTAFRTFKHGAFHGTFFGLVCVTPIMGVNALFERQRFGHLAINAGYWILSLALMGGIVSMMMPS